MRGAGQGRGGHPDGASHATRTHPQVAPLDDPEYPSDDGNPMADTMLQYRWIVTVQGGIDALFLDRDDVVVAGHCLWYPVEGEPATRMAPDVMVIFGRPRGDRGSYIQHREEGVPVHVVFEVLAPGNRAGAMRQKLAFYERHGAEEYDILDPDRAWHRGYRRDVAGKLKPIRDLFGWTSPRLGIRFEMTWRRKNELRIVAPDGRPFEHHVDLARKLEAAERRVEQANRRARDERHHADAEHDRVERLIPQLRALGIEPEA